ncbi:MAG: CHRD domain-containing protein [Burkholderiaceae bacterium]|jgi:hypothetical protein|nr:CHRD domain-containing protein [Burkholderiaceae bacterium]
MPFTFMTFPRAGAAALVAAVLMAACSSVSLERRREPPPVRMPQPLSPPQQPVTVAPQPGPQEDQQAHLVTLTTRLEGGAESPPNRSAGTGQFDAMYDTNTHLLRWKTSWSGLSGPITDVRFHGPAEKGQNGPPAMIWPAPFGPTYEGRATLTPQQEQDLLQGRWYLNVSSAMYPAGELRGQLRVVP